MASVRLQKVIAAGGVAARRKAEQLILEGRVTVNGKVVRELGTKVDPSRDRVSVDGEGVVAQDFFYVVFNKPKGCITAISDDRGRPTVMDYLPNVPIAVKPVGRLDFYTEGVLLLTNDGELAARLLASAGGVPKTYHAKLRGTVSREDLTRLRQGVTLDDGTVTLPAEVSLLPAESKHAWVALTIVEGKQRQIHRMFESLGHEVQKLQRVAFANLTFHGLRVGDARELNQQELNELRGLVGLDNSAVARGVWESRRETTDIPRRARAKARAEAEEAQALAEQAQVARENRRALATDDEMGDETDPATWMTDDIESSADSWGADEDEDGDHLMPVAPTRDFGVAARAGRSRSSRTDGAGAARGGRSGGAGGGPRGGSRGYEGGGAARGARSGGAGPRGGSRGYDSGGASAGRRGGYEGGGAGPRGGSRGYDGGSASAGRRGGYEGGGAPRGARSGGAGAGPRGGSRGYDGDGASAGRRGGYEGGGAPRGARSGGAGAGPRGGSRGYDGGGASAGSRGRYDGGGEARGARSGGAGGGPRGGGRGGYEGGSAPRGARSGGAGAGPRGGSRGYDGGGAARGARSGGAGGGPRGGGRGDEGGGVGRRSGARAGGREAFDGGTRSRTGTTAGGARTSRTSEGRGPRRGR